MRFMTLRGIRYLSLPALAVLFSCGGGGGGSTSLPNPVVFTRTIQADANAATIEDTTRGIKLIVPPGAFTGSSSVTLEVLERQRPGVIPNGYTSNANAINIIADITQMAANGTLQIQVPFAGTFDDLGTMVMLTDDSGAFLPVAVEYDSVGKTLKGTIPKGYIQQLGKVRSRGPGLAVGVFLALIAPGSLIPPTGNWFVYSNGSFVDASQRVMPTGRVAVLVHGFGYGASGLNDLGALVSGLACDSPAGQKIYREVWAYQYRWLAPIANSGARLATDLSLVIGSAEVDIYAHSEGGLVSRWALEKGANGNDGLGSRINRLVTLGTPHQGFPKEVVQLLMFTLATRFGIPVPPGTAISDMEYKPIDPLNLSFLNRMNNGSSPFKTTAQYYTLAGSDWGSYTLFGVPGSVVNRIYSIFFGSTIVNDGLVGQYSAQSDDLARKSDFWTSTAPPSPRATVALNHSELNGDSGFAQQGTLTNALAAWIHACAPGGPGITVTVSPPSISLNYNGTQQFAATVTGTTNHAVTWSVDGSGGGTVTSAGTYTAPASAGTFTVRATSHADPSKSGYALAKVSTGSGTGLANSPWPKFKADSGNRGRGSGFGASGQLQWAFNTGPSASTSIEGSASIGVDGTIYVGSVSNDPGGAHLFAIDGRTGDEKWRFTPTGSIASTPAIGANNFVYFGTTDGYLYALDASTGAQKWVYQTGVIIYASPAISSDGTVYIVSRPGNLFAIDGQTGTRKWTFSAGGESGSSPVVGPDGVIYLLSSLANGRLHAVYGQSGQLKWSVAIGYSFSSSSPVLATDGTLYVFGDALGNRLYALDSQTGATKWSSLVGGSQNSPSIGLDGTVYVASQDFYAQGILYALDWANGNVKWTFMTPTSRPFDISSPAIDGAGTVYVGAQDGYLYAVDGATGTMKWSFRTGATIYSSPCIGSDGTVYVGSTDGKVYAIR